MTAPTVPLERLQDRTRQFPAPAARAPAAARLLPALPLIAVLTVQMALTIRLMPYAGSDHADEAIYIYGGHQLIHELFHGGGSPYYETWYSGAPVLYPVLAAMADSIGGLAAARGMSLVFMLCATCLLHETGRRLFGYWEGITGAALFAGLGVTQNLGALATYDAMALMLTAFAAYAAVRAAGSTRWFLVIPVAVIVANAVKYMSVLFDPVIIALAALEMVPEGWRRVRQRAIALSAAVALLGGVLLFLAGSSYVRGVMTTTVARKGGDNVILAGHFAPASLIISLSWRWTGAIIVLAVIALAVAGTGGAERRRAAYRVALLVIAGALVTIGNLHLHTYQSMDKHDDFGAWFACIAAAWALSALAVAARRRALTVLAVIVIAVTVGWSGWFYSRASSFTSYFTATPLSSQESASGFLGPYLVPGGNEYLLGDRLASEVVYDNHSGIAWWQWFDDTYVKYPVPGRGGDPAGRARGLACGGPGQPKATAPGCMYLEGTAGFRTAIRAHWFAMVTLDDDHGISYDQVILAAVRATPGYVQVSGQEGQPTFIYAPDYRR